MTTNNSDKKPVYRSDELKRLSDAQHVRKRPAMYIGSTTRRGVHHLIEEVLDMMLDCHRFGRVSTILVELGKDGSVACCDDNTQCELKINEQLTLQNDRETTILEVSVATLSMGRTRHSIFSPFLSTRGSLHGTSLVVTNFLSDRFSVQACSEKEVFRQEYVCGERQGPVEVLPRTSEMGTRISFTPDPEIFPDEARSIDSGQMQNRLEILAYLNPGLKIQLRDNRIEEEHTFHFSRGLQDYLKNRGHLAEPFRESKSMFIKGKTEDIEFEIAIEPNPPVVSFVNDTRCEGGTHLTGFFGVMCDVLNEIGRRREIIRAKDALPTAGDYEPQLQGVMALRMKEPFWTGALKANIHNDLSDFLEVEIKPKLIAFFESEGNLTQKLILNAVSAANARC